MKVSLILTVMVLMSTCGVYIHPVLGIEETFTIRLDTVRSASAGSNARCLESGQRYVAVNRMRLEGHICSSGWDMKDSNVVCREMGFSHALPLDPTCVGSAQDRSVRRTWLSNVRCRGDETSLAECEHDGWGIHDCLPNQHVMVRCSAGEDPAIQVPGNANGEEDQCPVSSRRISGVRLYPSRHVNQERGGYLQVRVCNEWKGVCGDGWSASRAGEVACRQLGYPGVQYLFWGRVPAADRRRQSWLKRPTCTGLESFLHQCTYQGRLERQRCQLRRNAGVVCLPSEPTRHHAAAVSQAAGLRSERGSVRLRGGAFPSEGRVEVHDGTQWGVICELGWSLREANVVCRQLGYGSAFEATGISSRLFGRGFSHIMLNHVRCIGHERSLTACQYQGWRVRTCPDRERIAGVRCHAPDTEKKRQEIRLQAIREEDGAPRTPSYRRRGMIEVRENGEWGPICADENWNLEAGSVACRQLGYGYAFGVFTTSQGCSSKVEEGETIPTTKPPEKNIFEVVEGIENVEQAGFTTIEPSDAGSKTTVGAIIKPSKQSQAGLATVSGLLCAGDEFSLRQCEHKTYTSGGSPCTNCKYAAVECAYALPDLVPDHLVLEESLYDVEYRTLRSLQCSYEEGCLASSADAQMASGRAGVLRRGLLRFTVTMRNLGLDDFRPVLNRDSWIWHACHHHFHSFDNFATYDILDMAGNEVAEGHKASFCLEDTDCHSIPGGRHYYSCAEHRQGISLRCADVYGRDLDCQWIDITDIPDGVYVLRVSANINRVAAELDYSNNVVECQLTLTHGSYDRFYELGRITNVTCTAEHLR